MILHNKVAVIYGAGGGIGSAIGRGFARGSHRVSHGPPACPVGVIAEEIVSAGEAADAAEVDALDQQAVDEHLQSMIDMAGRVDISFDAIGISPKEEEQGTLLIDLPPSSLHRADRDRRHVVLPDRTLAAELRYRRPVSELGVEASWRRRS
jgi:NAD(P)-dependent dehydrogenase (short-subunit alcohol dehydrogenase family)